MSEIKFHARRCECCECRLSRISENEALANENALQRREIARLRSELDSSRKLANYLDQQLDNRPQAGAVLSIADDGKVSLKTAIPEDQVNQGYTLLDRVKVVSETHDDGSMKHLIVPNETPDLDIRDYLDELNMRFPYSKNVVSRSITPDVAVGAKDDWLHIRDFTEMHRACRMGYDPRANLTEAIERLNIEAEKRNID
jgi:hypothetical protein